MIKKILIPALLIAAFTACKDSGVDTVGINPFTQKEVLGVYNNDKSLFIYDKDLFQYSFNTERMTFRIQNAAQDRFLFCQLNSPAYLNETVGLRIETSGISSIPTQGLDVKVLKKADGKVWLWNEEQQLGIIIRIE